MPINNREKIIKLLKDNPGATIVGHYLGKQEKGYRMRDAKVNPLMNITSTEHGDLLRTDVIIEKEKGIWMLNN